MKVLITGGAGFIGVNAAENFIKKGNEVFIIDNLSRIGSRVNLKFLECIGSFTFGKLDIQNNSQLLEYIKNFSPFDVILHFAAQVAVTTSVRDPRQDFEINALGTINLLEAVRKYSPESIFIYASTNKVYGVLDNIEFAERKSYYELIKPRNGISEDQCLDFYSPYGCSKGSADQYVKDYSRIYGMKNVVCRQSCIYGPHQFGIEDQGWIAWFAIRTLLNKPIYIYGSGKQVRDLLFIDDLVNLYEIIIRRIKVAEGKVYNIGGGIEHCASLLQVLEVFKELGYKAPKLIYKDWRYGDQKIYVSDISFANKSLGWIPKANMKTGMKKLLDWIKENINLIEKYVI